MIGVRGSAFGRECLSSRSQGGANPEICTALISNVAIVKQQFRAVSDAKGRCRQAGSGSLPPPPASAAAPAPASSVPASTPTASAPATATPAAASTPAAPASPGLGGRRRSRHADTGNAHNAENLAETVGPNNGDDRQAADGNATQLVCYLKEFGIQFRPDLALCHFSILPNDKILSCAAARRNARRLYSANILAA